MKLANCCDDHGLSSALRRLSLAMGKGEVWTRALTRIVARHDRDTPYTLLDERFAMGKGKNRDTGI